MPRGAGVAQQFIVPLAGQHDDAAWPQRLLQAVDGGHRASEIEAGKGGENIDVLESARFQTGRE